MQHMRRHPGERVSMTSRHPVFTSYSRKTLTTHVSFAQSSGLPYEQTAAQTHARQQVSSSSLVPIVATWQRDAEYPEASVLVLESTHPFRATITQHMQHEQEAAQPLASEYDGQGHSLVVRRLTAKQVVHVFNHQCILAINGLSLLPDDEENEQEG